MPRSMYFRGRITRNSLEKGLIQPYIHLVVSKSDDKSPFTHRPSDEELLSRENEGYLLELQATPEPAREESHCN